MWDCSVLASSRSPMRTRCSTCAMPSWLPASRAIRARSAAFAEKWKIAARATMDEVCADPRVEIVIVALPNEVHLEAVEIAARHKKAIICTKPLGAHRRGGAGDPRRGQQGRRLARLCRELGVLAQCRQGLRDGRGRRHRRAADHARPRGAFRSARTALLGRRDGGRRGAARHGLPHGRNRRGTSSARTTR